MYEICLNTTEEYINVWDLNVHYRDRGETYVIDSQTRQYTPLGEHIFKRFMLNYFGIGEDARIAMGFEQRRTANKCTNECVYVWEGLKKMCCNRTRRIKHQLEYMATEKDIDPENIPIVEENKESILKSL